MPRHENLVLIDAFEAAYDPIESVLKGLSAKALAFVPDVEDAWSSAEHLVHLLDADCSLWFRARRAIAQPGAPVPDWDEEAWKERLAYGELEPIAAFALAKSLRSMLASSLRAQADRDWDAFKVLHPSRGELKLAAILLIYTKHAATHLGYIERNLGAFRQAKG